ncbi:Fic family protein [Massilia violaceinigra]|uniref:protein adenylyltransferase n=1 Tax=Massilia violaceinigra TaxID=2045208 RepID=A0ABY4AAS5_9BURK|nr:Fic family protein [Massilia violaceinigra]UOD29693.1 Fic family protein [Massilia violaceinigra]
MFDPFGDFEIAGYLRNFAGEKDLTIIKAAEHALFRAQLPVALEYLAQCPRIRYEDFCNVHRLLFSGLYPWAGVDRAQLIPDKAISKGPVYFCHPHDCHRAVEDGLSRAQEGRQLASRPGFIMGLFAYAHPFLDGNGRTMLLVHAELCFRAGMSIDWTRTQKEPYLQALTREIEAPAGKHLDTYLLPFLGPPVARHQWQASVTVLPGLEGGNVQADTAKSYADLEVASCYAQFERKRVYRSS